MFKFFLRPLFAVCLIIFGAISIFAGHKNATEFSALLDHGETTEAEVIKLEWKEKKGSYLDSSYTADIRFKTENGREIRDTMHLTDALGRALRHQGGKPTITISYLPESPHTFHDASRIDPSTAQAQSGVGRYALIIGFLILVLRFFSLKMSEFVPNIAFNPDGFAAG